MEKILKISMIVILLVAIIYLIVGTFFTSNAKTGTKFDGFGQMVSPGTKASSKSTDKLEVTLDKILINMSSGQYNYMKSDISFKMKDEKNKERIKENMPRIRDTILRFSASQDSDKLATDEGKQEYKKNIKDIIYESYGIEVNDIYFRNFVLAR